MSSLSVSEWGYVMNDLKRKYDGLKQAHKELSVEVVGLREKVDVLERDRRAAMSNHLVGKVELRDLKDIMARGTIPSNVEVFETRCPEDGKNVLDFDRKFIHVPYCRLVDQLQGVVRCGKEYEEWYRNADDRSSKALGEIDKKLLDATWNAELCSAIHSIVRRVVILDAIKEADNG